MRIRSIIAVAITISGLTSAALGDKYDDLVRKGYRWVSTDGPFACPSKDDLQRIVKNQNDENEIRMVEQLKAYFLVRGALVQVVQEDKSFGMTQFSGGGLSCWTLTKFLSKRPIANLTGTIETPVPSGSPSTNISANGQPGESAMPGATATPSGSPSPSP
jgi:hypothetical protein